MITLTNSDEFHPPTDKRFHLDWLPSDPDTIQSFDPLSDTVGGNVEILFQSDPDPQITHRFVDWFHCTFPDWKITGVHRLSDSSIVLEFLRRDTDIHDLIDNALR